MPKEIQSFFSKAPSYAEKRKAALEKRKQLLADLKIDTVVSFFSREMNRSPRN